MSHTKCYQYIHIVFGTKELQKLINDKSADALFGFLYGVINNLNGFFIDKSASEDHIHLLINLPTSCSIADFVCKIKTSSSKWLRESQHPSNMDFGWNEGYSAFTVSPESIEKVKQYFCSEKTRHVSLSFKEELQKFLNLHQIKYKPEFMTKTTYTKLKFHIVWSVKNREAILDSSIKPQLHNSINKIINDSECTLHAIENVSDHIHLLVEMPSKINTASLVQNIKTSTAHLINNHMKYGKFYWQEGFGSFSVGQPSYDVVKKYIQNQEAHHKNQPSVSSNDEYNKIVSGNFVS